MNLNLNLNLNLNYPEKKNKQTNKHMIKERLVAVYKGGE